MGLLSIKSASGFDKKIKSAKLMATSPVAKLKLSLGETNVNRPESI